MQSTETAVVSLKRLKELEHLETNLEDIIKTAVMERITRENARKQNATMRPPCVSTMTEPCQVLDR